MRFSAFTDSGRDRTLVQALDGNEWLISLANGGQCGFTTGDQEVIDVVKQAVGDTLQRQRGSPSDRLHSLFGAILEGLVANFPFDKEDDPFWCAYATFGAVIVNDRRLFGVNVGPEQFKIFRHGKPIHEMTAHVVDLPTSTPVVGNSCVISQDIEADHSVIQVVGPWVLESGDTLIAADYRLFAQGSDAEVLEAATSARPLVEWAQERTDGFGQAAIVAHL